MRNCISYLIISNHHSLDYSFLGFVVVMTFDMLQWMQNQQRSREMSINKRWFYILISKCKKIKHYMFTVRCPRLVHSNNGWSIYCHYYFRCVRELWNLFCLTFLLTLLIFFFEFVHGQWIRVGKWETPRLWNHFARTARTDKVYMWIDTIHIMGPMKFDWKI